MTLNIRITYKSVFGITFLLGWVFFGFFGDFNLYVGGPSDPRRWVKEYATLSDCIIGGFLIAVIFAAVDTFALWLWRRFCGRRESLSSPVHHIS